MLGLFLLAMYSCLNWLGHASGAWRYVCLFLTGNSWLYQAYGKNGREKFWAFWFSSRLQIIKIMPCSSNFSFNITCPNGGAESGILQRKIEHIFLGRNISFLEEKQLDNECMYELIVMCVFYLKVVSPTADGPCSLLLLLDLINSSTQYSRQYSF